MNGNITLPDWQFERKPGSLGLEGQEPSGAGYTPNSSGQYIATTGFGKSADGLTQTLHGIKGQPGYDANHGVGNDHVHHGAPDAATALELAKFLKGRGFPITEFKPWTSVANVHKDPGHYNGASMDIPIGTERHGEALKAINEFYVMKGRRGQGPQQASRGGTHAVPQIKTFAQMAGFNPSQARIMAAIAMAESSGRASAHNPNASTGDDSYGLWQINMLGGMGPERRRALRLASNKDLFDPVTNARAAKHIFDQQGFKAWSVYRSGAYKEYL
jgi:hypothetical protein